MNFQCCNSFLGKFGPKKLSVLPWNGAHGIFWLLILILTLVSEFQNLNSFLGKFSLKKSNYTFLLRIGLRSIMRMLVLIPTLVFSNFKPKSLGYWFLFWDKFFKIPNLNLFLRQIWVKKLNSPFCLEACTENILRMWL